MSLLTDLQAEALEPEYRTTRAARRHPARSLIVVGLLATVLSLSVLQSIRTTDIAAQQRQDLLQRITDARDEQAALGQSASQLDDEIRELGTRALGDPQLRQELRDLELAAGAESVTGPGIVVVVDDASEATTAQGRVLDGDLNRLVNGLRQAGAEAIAINGRRLTVLTPIRSAGAAITVDFVSLSPPYEVAVIGNPDNLQARFNQTMGAAWWHLLVQNYGLSMSVSQADEITLPADPGMTLRHAKQKQEE